MLSADTEVNGATIEEISDGNSLCKLCFSYLTLGRNEEIQRDNLHVHFNGRKHKFRCKMFEKYGEDSNNSGDYDNNSQQFESFVKRFYLKPATCDVWYLYENGISCDIKRDFNFYCNYCDCDLPQLSKDKNSNIFNVIIHTTSKRHILNVLCNYGEYLTDRDKNNNDTSDIFPLQNVKAIVKIPQLHTSITAAVYLDDKCLTVDEILINTPDYLQHQRSSVSCVKKLCKFRCTVCDCIIGISNKKFKMVNILSCHIQGRKHLHLYKTFNNGSSSKIMSADEIEDSNLMKIIRMSKNKIINKNEFYICRNPSGNIMCKLCKCVLPAVGQGGYLLAIKNFEIHFSGKRHCRILTQNLKQEINNSIISKDGKCDELILKLFKELPNNLLKSNVNSFMVTENFNLVCKICSCIIYRKIECISLKEQVTFSLEKHIQTSKHLKNYVLKESLKNFNGITLKLNNSVGLKNECKVLSDDSELVIKLNSSGQLVCSLCHKIINSKNCELEVAVTSHLKGKIHKCKIAKQSNNLTENIIVDIIKSLPKDYKINLKCLSFIYEFGIINCNICNYMFMVNSNNGLRNNLMIHITSIKHKNALSNVTVDSDDGEDDEDDNSDHVAIENSNLRDMQLSTKDEEYVSELFRNYIKANLRDNEKYISYNVNSKRMCCSLCSIFLSVAKRPESLAKNLMAHLKGIFHLSNLKNIKCGDSSKNKISIFITNHKITVNDEKYLTDILSYIGSNLKLNSQCIFYKKFEGFFCCVCNCQICSEFQPEDVAVKVFDHFCAIIHKNSLMKLPINNDALEVRRSNDRDKIISFQQNCDKVSKTKNTKVVKDLESVENIVKEGSSKKFVNSELSINKISCSTDDTKYVSEIFSNYIEENLRDNEKYITCNNNSNRMSCSLCSMFFSVGKRPESLAKNLMAHLKGNFHLKKKKNLMSVDPKFKKNSKISNFIPKYCDISINKEKYLNDIFNCIDPDLKSTFRCIFYQRLHGFFCYVCNCKICCVLSPEDVARRVVDHLNCLTHKDTFMKFKKICNKAVEVSNSNDCDVIDFKKYNDRASKTKSITHELFTDFIPEDLHFNKKYITVETNKICCELCDTKIAYVSPRATAPYLVSHLKGILHESKLNKTANGLGNQYSTVKTAVEDPYKDASTTITSRMVTHYASGSSTVLTDYATIALTLPNSNEASSICSYNSNISKRGIETLLDDVFKNFISLNLQFNRQLISVEKSNIICNVCHCKLSKSTKPEGLARLLTEHMKGGVHKYYLKLENKTASTSYDINISSTSDDCKKYEAILDKVYITEKTCTRDVSNSYEKFLDNVFQTCIPLDLQFNRQFLIVNPDKLICIVCDCIISKCTSIHSASHTLMEHLKGYNHSYFIKTRNTHNTKVMNKSTIKGGYSSYKKFLDDVFAKYIPSEIQFNREFLIIKSDTLTCCICHWTISKCKHLQPAANILFQHIKGSSHVRNLEKRSAADAKKIRNFFLCD